MRQVAIDLEGGLLTQFPEFREVVLASVTGCGRAHKSVAADLDMTSSELSRKLANNPADPVHFPLHRLPDLMRATGDKRPLYWLIEAFLDGNADEKRKRAAAELADMLPRLKALLQESA